MSEEACPFCEIVVGRAPASFVRKWREAVAFEPLDPVTPGHILVVPRIHVPDFTTAPVTTATAMQRAAELAREMPGAVNLITSRGREATQSVFHLHLHLVPRTQDDGLALPWYSGRRGRRDEQTVR